MYGFTVRSLKARALGFKDDSFDFDEERGIACVADGVTRDSKNGHVVTSLRGLAEVLAFGYPGYAADASRIAVNTFMLDRTLEAVNREIGDYNFNVGLVSTDYLGRDLAGCTFASVISLCDPKSDPVEIDVQYIADAGVAIVGKEGGLIKTDDEGPHSPEKNPHLEKVLSEHGGWTSQEGRRFIREFCRNKPNQPFSYGVLTGETDALSYVKEMTLWTNQGDYVLLFTDGVGELLFPQYGQDEEKNKKKKKVRDGCFRHLFDDSPSSLEALCQKNVHTEGTLVVWKVE